MGAFSRRQALRGLGVGALVVGFDPVARAWATEGGPGVVSVPPLDGELTTDRPARREAADDYGHIVHRLPVAVLRPGSVNDITVMVRYARMHRLRIAMRGQGHVCFGQAQVDAGIVIDSRTLDRIHDIGPDRAVVDPGVTWADLLRATAAHGLTPPVLTDFMGLSVGGTLSSGGIGGASLHHGVQVDTARELKVVTGKGEVMICSPRQHQDLFDSVLAGFEIGRAHV